MPETQIIKVDEGGVNARILAKEAEAVYMKILLRFPDSIEAGPARAALQKLKQGAESTTPPGGRPAEAPEAAPWALVYGEQLVALIPADEASLAGAMQLNNGYKIATPAKVFAGSYVIHGTLLSYDTNASVFQNFRCFPMQDVQITSRLPGAQWSGLKAPYLAVMSQHKQLIVPE